MPEELAVGVEVEQLRLHEVHGLDAVHFVQDLAQDPDPLELFGVAEELLLASPRATNLDRGEHPAISEGPVEVELHVAGALELLEDDLVHAGVGLDQSRGNDRQRAAELNVPRRAEEALGSLEGVGVDTAREDLAAGRDLGVVGAAEAGDRVEQDHDVAPVLDHSLGLVDHHFGDLDVARSRLVEGRGHDLGRDGPAHVRDLFRALVDQENDQVALGVVLDDRVGQLLEQDRLTGPRRSHDQAALALSDRGQEVHDPHFCVLGLTGLEGQALIRIERRQVLEVGHLDQLVGRLLVDGLELLEDEELVALLGATNPSLEEVSGPEAPATNLARRHVNVVR